MRFKTKCQPNFSLQSSPVLPFCEHLRQKWFWGNLCTKKEVLIGNKKSHSDKDNPKWPCPPCPYPPSPYLPCPYPPCPCPPWLLLSSGHCPPCPCLSGWGWGWWRWWLRLRSIKVSLVELGYPLNSWEHTRLQTGWVLDGLDRITNPH